MGLYLGRPVDLRYVYTGRDKQRDILQRDLLRGNSVYTIGSCRAGLLHIIHVSAVFEVGVLQRKLLATALPRGNYKFKLKLPPGLTAVARLLGAACRHVNAPVVFLCFNFAARLSRRSRAACRVPCKRSFIGASAQATGGATGRLVILYTDIMRHHPKWPFY